MDALLLEGWLPIIVVGIVSFAAIITLAKFSSRSKFYAVTFSLMVLSLLMLVYSFVVVGRWTGMGMAFYCITIFSGLTAGLFVGMLIKK